jgi:hypothetical protein
LLYTTFSILGYISYGANVQPSVFENIKHDSGFLSYAIRIIFVGLFFCNISFIFMIGKDSLLIILLEAKQREISKILSKVSMN